METQEQIDKLKEFIQEYYEEKAHNLVNKGISTLIIDFSDLLKFEPEIADSLIEDPEEIIKATEIAAEESLGLGEFKVRFHNLPKSQFIMIKDIRSLHLGKFMYIEGIVRQASDVRPQVTSARFECPSCGNTISILQLDTKFKEPSRCTCGKRGNFRLLSKDLVDAQRLVIEEVPESLEGGEQPKRLSVFLKEDLVEPRMEKKTTPGSKVRITGIIKEVPVLLKTGVQSIRFDLMMDSNFIEPIEETFEDISLDEDDVRKIKELASNPLVYEKLTASIAPSIYGHEKIKEALVLQLMGGVKKERPDGTKTRGDMHVLLVGDPGTAKSSLITSVSKVAPKARIASGKSASGAGLCLAPDSLVPTNPGGIYKLQDLVNQHLEYNCKEYKPGIWKSKNNKNNKKIFTLSDNLKINTGKISGFWKIEPPDCMIEITLRSGKVIKVTPNTKLYTINNGIVNWKESTLFNKGDFLATSRGLNFLNNNKLFIADLIRSNPIVYGIKSKIKLMLDVISKKETLRDFSRRTGFSEGNLYYCWVNTDARGSIHLDDLKVLIKESKYDVQEVYKDITHLSLYKGHKIRIPLYVNNDLLYFAGLIAGDGDITKSRHSATIRLSNNSEQIIKAFKNISYNLFGIRPCISGKKDSKRAEAWRISSIIIFEILNSFGIPMSPKSEKLDMSNVLLRLPNKLIASFIQGCFDADGSIIERKSKGSNQICYSTSSKTFAAKLQLLLLRFRIYSKIRSRKPTVAIRKDGKEIKTRYFRYEIEIAGKKNLVIFKNKINFKLNEKKEKLQNVISKIKIANTNIDIIPKAHLLLEEIGIKYKKFIKKGAKGITRKRLGKLLHDSKNFNSEGISRKFSYLKNLSKSDIFWDEIVSVHKNFNHGYGYVYDITVENSHNFIANGVVVHNTAVVVRDEFLRGWALEAGAMVLANGGYLFIDELDKMTKEDRDALHEGLEQQRISIAKANIQACYSEDTEVLTEEGWKSYSEVEESRIAQYNPKECIIKFLPHDGLYIYDYDGKMYHFKNKRVDILVTPNHRMFAKERSQKNFQIIEAKNINYSLTQFVNSGNYDSEEEIEYFILPAITHKQKRTHHKYVHQHKPKTIPMDLWIEFIGYYATEGGIQKEPTIGIVQKYDPNSDKIKMCLEQLARYVGFTLSKTRDSNRYIRFQITSTQLFRFLELNCGKNHMEKRLPLKLSSLSKRQLTILYNAMMLGDGSSDGKTFSSTSKILIDDFQALVCLLGKSASQHISYEDKSRGNRVRLYRVMTSKYTRPYIEKKQIKRINYNGKVFCFSTKTGFFITRRNGKIAIQGNTLRCETTVLAAANPKLGRFDPYTPLASQIDLPSTLINRFDLIFPIRDLPNKEADARIASHVLGLHKEPEKLIQEINADFFKKYLSYIRQKVKPKLSDDAIEEIKNFYVELRNSVQPGDQAIKPIPISARQLEALVRLAEGSAKVRLSKEVTKEDAKRAIELLRYCLMQVGFDPETGQIDIDRITTGIPSSQRSRIITIREMIKQLEEKVGKQIPLDSIINEAIEKGIERSHVLDAIEKLKREGEIFEPRLGIISKL